MLREKACELAKTIHEGHIRKSSGESYFDAHLQPVAELLAGAGCDELTIAVGYLHDSVEDRGGPETEERIDALDKRILPLVLQLSENKEGTWDERKQSVISHIPNMDPRAAAVKAADVLSNLLGLVETGKNNPNIWDKFKVGREKSLWFYHECITALHYRGDVPVALLSGLSVVYRFVEEEI